MPSDLWHAQPEVMRLELPRFAAVVDPLDPARGVHDIRLDACPLSGAGVLEVELSPVAPQAIEYFLRGGDLAITYADRPERAMRTQVYWRACSHALNGAIAAIELLVSVQTSLLDSCPRLATRSELVVDDVLRLSATPPGSQSLNARDESQRDSPDQASGYLFRLAGCKLSYAEIVHPAGAHPALLETRAEGPGQRVQLGHRLFAERLEKGVILRARALGLWLERAGDQDAALQHFQAFMAAELPLTT